MPLLLLLLLLLPQCGWHLVPVWCVVNFARCHPIWSKVGVTDAYGVPGGRTPSTCLVPLQQCGCQLGAARAATCAHRTNKYNF